MDIDYTELLIGPFFNMTPDLVCIAGKDGFFKKINNAVVEKLGYSETELMGRPINSFIHPEDQGITAAKRSSLLEGSPLLNFQNRYVSKNGNIIWLEWTSVYFGDKEVVFAIAKDITIRKKMELGIQEKYSQVMGLAQHFKNSLEQERKVLATELHEELAQLASVLKMEMEWIRDHVVVKDAGAFKRINHSLDIANLLVNTIRQIAYEISPNMLDDVGLEETLLWLCGQMTNENSLKTELKFSINEDLLSRELKLDIYRICQKAINGIHKRGLAKKAHISITQQNRNVCLNIIDDGLQQNTEEAPAIANGIRELIASLHGQVIVESSAAQGSSITAIIALDEEDSKWKGYSSKVNSKNQFKKV